MITKKNFLILKLLGLPRYVKKTFILILDIFLCIFTNWLALSLRLDNFINFNNEVVLASFISSILALPLFFLFGLYKSLFRYYDINNFYKIFQSVFIYSLIYLFVIGFYKIENIPRSIAIIQPLLLLVFVLCSRAFLSYLLIITDNKNNKLFSIKKIIIYGAGSAGRQLVSALKNKPQIEIVGFIDDNKDLTGQLLDGFKIFLPENLDQIIKKNKINLILLAIPSINKVRRNQIIKHLSNYKILIQSVPSINDIVSGKVHLSEVSDLDFDDLLTRDHVLPKQELLNEDVNSKIVLVTGAGGSIGSELSRQIITLGVKELILLDFSEYSLYKIYQELLNLNTSIKIIPLLTDICDENKINNIFKNFKIETVYHSAAYKHVSLVEENICEGIKNNIFGTLTLINAAINSHTKSFVYVSSDKAVRPTSVMGASKRVAELCIQAIFHEKKNSKIKMSIVRFGNVIGSSGSVIPKFRDQIKNGGPITLTHPEVRRYFMTSKEAAQLVIQSGAMAQRCDIFVLDMGESIKIRDLISNIIKLSGLKLKDENNVDGDIEIKITGLKPGEKLYEELILGEKLEKTEHPKIKKAKEPFIFYKDLVSDLNELRNLLINNNIIEIKKILSKIIGNYNPNSKITDYIYLNKQGL